MDKFASGIGLAVALVLAAFLAAVVMFVFLMSFLAIVSPSLTDDARVLQFMAFVSVVAVLGVPALLHLLVRDVPELGLRHGEKPAEVLVPDINQDEARRLMIRNYRIRSRLFKVASGSALFVMLVVALLGFNVAGSTGAETASDTAADRNPVQGVDRDHEHEAGGPARWGVRRALADRGAVRRERKTPWRDSTR